MTQAQQDKEFDEKVKRGELVSFNDPSISAKTREILTGANRRIDLSKSHVQKGLDLKSYKDMYGDDFNPVQFRKDALSGKLDKYEAGVIHTAKEGTGTYTRGVTPVKPGAYVPGPALKKIETKNVDWKERKLDPLKPTKIDQKKGKLRMPKEKEDLTWDAPKFVKAKGVGVPQTRIKQSGKSGVQGAGKKKMVGGTEGSRIKYNTESRQSMAYFSGNTSIGDKITGKTESELRDLKKETRGEGGRMLKEGRLGDALTIGKDLATIRKATRYAKKGGIYTGDSGSINEGQESTLKYFTPEKTKRMSQDGKIVRNDGAMAGYRDFKNQESEKAFRSQADNPANRNRSWDRLQGPSEGASNSPATQGIRDQQKTKFKTDNPTATPGQIRRGGRNLQKADELLMKKVDKKIIK